VRQQHALQTLQSCCQAAYAILSLLVLMATCACGRSCRFRQLAPSLLGPRKPSTLLLQTLTANDLRERVVLRVDGGMRSGRDVLVAAALGGDEYGFGTVAMIATGGRFRTAPSGSRPGSCLTAV
jgi:Conserved region in glutamate synthase